MERNNKAKIAIASVVIVFTYVLLSICGSFISLIAIQNEFSNEDLSDERISNECSLIVEPFESNRISLMSETISDSDIAVADSSKTVRITATITDGKADDKIDWSITFKNPNSEWANGKTVTDYVTLTPTADGALTADVSFVVGFSEQIIVTATIRNKPECKASATVDYAYRYYYSGIEFEPATSEFSDCTAKIVAKYSKLGLSGKPVGTVESSTDTPSISIEPNENFFEFYDAVVFPSLQSILGGDTQRWRNSLKKHVEYSSDTSLIPQLYGICIQDDSSFPFPTSVSFMGGNMTAENIKLHTRRLYGYPVCFDSSLSDAIFNMPIEHFRNIMNESLRGLEELFIQVDTAINNKVKESVGRFGINEIFSGLIYGVRNAFTVTFSYTYNGIRVSKTLDLAYVFGLL